MRCSNCQNEVPDGLAFCPTCQSPMSQGSTVACPNCGYPPANPNSTICPYCHSPLPVRVQNIQETEDSNIDIDDTQQPVIPGAAPLDTDMPVYEAAPVPVPEPEAVPVPEPEPEPEPVPEPVPEPEPESSDADVFELRQMISPLMPPSAVGVSFEGQSVVLNGRNLPSPMMDAECQAVVSRNADGNWVIVNGSQNQSTYMLVNRPMALRDGDVILLGGNLYVFHTNEKL